MAAGGGLLLQVVQRYQVLLVAAWAYLTGKPPCSIALGCARLHPRSAGICLDLSLVYVWGMRDLGKQNIDLWA